MGYQAVAQVLRQSRGEPPPAEPIKVATHLVLRESCGCSSRDAAPWRTIAEPEQLQLARRRLVEAFMASVERDDPAVLREAVDAILQQVAQGWDDAGASADRSFCCER